MEQDNNTDILTNMKSKNDQHKEEMRQNLKEMKSSNPDKEVFNIDKFVTLCDITNDAGKLKIDTELVEKYEMEYYLNHPDFETMQEFADYRQTIELNNAN